MLAEVRRCRLRYGGDGNRCSLTSGDKIGAPALAAALVDTLRMCSAFSATDPRTTHTRLQLHRAACIVHRRVTVIKYKFCVKKRVNEPQAARVVTQ